MQVEGNKVRNAAATSTLEEHSGDRCTLHSALCTVHCSNSGGAVWRVVRGGGREGGREWLCTVHLYSHLLPPALKYRNLNFVV